MLFIQATFLVFFAIVFLIYWSLPQLTLRKLFILAASYVFYAAWDVRFLTLIIGCTLVNYWLGALISTTRKPATRKSLLILAISANMGVLCIFKYLNFFAESFVALASWLGVEIAYTTLHIVLPVGISFYLFQTTSYVIDIYKGRIEPSRRLLDFSVYVAFFPQLIAGPIVRASEFLPQLVRETALRDVPIRFYLFMFAVGFFKKACIADNLAIHADPVFADVGAYTAYTQWLAALIYTVQLYCDFSGYSDMAIALAGLLGFKLPVNFFFPYFSPNLGEFWRRWHITLSNWLRDYVYFPLGGSRGSEVATYRNLMVTFGLNGLWHGAAFGFVIWGLGNGLGVAVYRLWTKSRLSRIFSIPHAVAVAMVFVFITLIRVPFRTPDLQSAIDMYGIMFGAVTAGALTIQAPVEPVLIGLAVVHWIFYRFPIDRFIWSLPQIAFAGGLGFVAALAIGLLPIGYSPFIYFQF
ncbi:MAG: MBOAT family O-acyltransferase [Geminicoccaceae bacterium]